MTLAIILIAILNFVCFGLWFRILRESKPQRVANESNTFPIIEPNPVQRTGNSGCVLWLSLVVLILGTPSGDHQVIIVAAWIPLVWLGAVAQSELNFNRHQKTVKESRARIEMLENSVQIFSHEGEIIRSTKFDDIVDLAKYQGFDTTSRSWFNISVLRLQDGGEFIIPESTISCPLLLKKIEGIKQQKFQYRRNSTRHSH